MKSKIRLDRAKVSSKQATKFAISIGKSMFSSAMFDFERMRSLGYNSNGADDLSVFISMRFRLSTLMLICMRFHLYPLSRAFSNRCVFDENAQRFSVDRRPKRIEMYAFSNENAVVWTGPQSRF